MPVTALLILIYIAFISLGIPDSLLGAAWPAMHGDLGASLSLAGTLSMLTSTCTVISGLLSARLISRFGTARVTAVSVLLTAGALLGLAASGSFWVTAALCVPLGLGGGAIDSGLNNFVALHYKARHMNWLHCFWGIGATAGPILIAALLDTTGQWRTGYAAMGVVQMALALVMVLSMPLWKKVNEQEGAVHDEDIVPMKLRDVVRLPLAFPVFATLLAYCGGESVMTVWGASFLVEARSISPQTAASWVSLYFLGITGGRFLSGVVSSRLRTEQMIRLGVLCSLAGAALLLVPLWDVLLPVGFFVVGLGFAPIFPSMLHQTPRVFGPKASQSVMGTQMAFAYIGATLTPPLSGAIAHATGLWIMPVILTLLIAIMLAASQYIQRRLRAR